jgi:hypothetical protein
MNLFIKNILPYLIVILTMTSVSQWSSFPIGNTVTDWALFLIIFLLLLSQKKYWYNKCNSKNLWFVKVYLWWVMICFIRGLLVAENYWDYKNLINGSFALFMAYAVYNFTNPFFLQQVLKKWMKFALPLFILFIPLITRDAYGFYLVPISFLILFLPIINFKWKLILVTISIFVVLSSLESRTSVVKFIIPILFSLLFFFKNFLKSKLLKIIHLVVFVLPLLLLLLAANDTFNVFKMQEYISPNTSTVIQNAKGEEQDLLGDSRTFLYKEVIFSAIKNDYVLFGRTLARGNDSVSFGYAIAKDIGVNRFERYSNEVSILNVFTWTGLLGVFLYFFIFYKAAYLAITNSNSYFLKILGLYVSFRWVTAWVEDFNRFNIMNLIIWIVIAICYSEQFRKMSDRDFKFWVNGVFKKNTLKKSLINYQVPVSKINNFNSSEIIKGNVK